MTTQRTPGRSDYAERVDNRADRLENRAAQARATANDQSTRAGDLLPSCGTPILKGHHSETRHRNAFKKHDTLMFKAVAGHKEADHLERRAAAVGTGGISSDDPEVLTKLRAKAAKLTDQRDRAKAVNKLIKSTRFKSLPTYQQTVELARATGWKRHETERLLEPNELSGKPGFPSFEVNGLTARIRDVKKRIADIEEELSTEKLDRVAYMRTATGELLEVRGYSDGDEERVCLEFSGDLPGDKEGSAAGRPAKYSWHWFCKGPGNQGFNYSRNSGRMQRKLNKSGRNTVIYILNMMKRDFPLENRETITPVGLLNQISAS